MPPLWQGLQQGGQPAQTSGALAQDVCGGCWTHGAEEQASAAIRGVKVCVAMGSADVWSFGVFGDGVMPTSVLDGCVRVCVCFCHFTVSEAKRM